MKMKIKLTLIKYYPNFANLKKQINKENHFKSGIYCLINSKTGKMYIGSSKELRKRFYNYYSDKSMLSQLKYKKDHDNIYNALLKHKRNNFSLLIFEYCESDLLRIKEKNYIKFFQPQYNKKK